MGREKYLLVMIWDLKGIHGIRILGSLCILSDLPSDYKIKLMYSHKWHPCFEGAEIEA